ncbi:MAG: CYTH domain-containing protein [Oscillospiraceae bacterium]|nr:CYTH domain-containing protein [Oscillospiraceae bacterium]
MGREFELKYAADAAVLEAMRVEAEDWTEFSMATAYYDTPAGDLSKLRWTLRRRFENGVSVCTLKTPHPDGGRGEWEVECGEILAALPLLCRAGAPDELLDLTAGGITEVCAAQFTRFAAPVVLGNCTVELALDAGKLLGGGKALPFAEVEVELKSGDEATAVGYAKALAEKYGLRPEPKSKYARALTLAGKR